MRYAVVTFGCRVNQADSLAVEAGLTGAGDIAVTPERADVVLVNTCSVTASADQGARQTIRRIHRENPAARIVVTGCYASRCGAEVAALPGVTEVVVNDDKPRLLQVLRAGGVGEEGRDDRDGPCGRTPGPGLMGRTAWTLRAQTGCDEPCSYCIIPTTRGTSRSRTLEEVLAELARVVAAGYKEVALTGVHLGAWGRDLDGRCRLSDLLAALGRRSRRVPSPRQLARADGLHRRGDRMARRSARPLRAAPPPPAAARRESDAAGDAPAVFARQPTPGWSTTFDAACLTRPSARTSSSGSRARPTRTPRPSRPTSSRRR